MFLYLLQFVGLFLFLGLSGSMIILGILALTNAGFSEPNPVQKVFGLLSVCTGILGLYLIFSSITLTINH